MIIHTIFEVIGVSSFIGFLSYAFTGSGWAFVMDNEIVTFKSFKK